MLTLNFWVQYVFVALLLLLLVGLLTDPWAMVGT